MHTPRRDDKVNSEASRDCDEDEDNDVCVAHSRDMACCAASTNVARDAQYDAPILCDDGAVNNDDDDFSTCCDEEANIENKDDEGDDATSSRVIKTTVGGGGRLDNDISGGGDMNCDRDLP